MKKLLQPSLLIIISVFILLPVVFTAHSSFSFQMVHADGDGDGGGSGDDGSGDGDGDAGNGSGGCGNGGGDGAVIAGPAIKELTFLPDSPHDPSAAPIDINHYWYYYTPSGEGISPPARVSAARTTIPYNTSTTLRWTFTVYWDDSSPYLPPNARCEAAEAWSGDKPLTMVGPMGFGGGDRTVDFIGSESTGNLTSQKVYDIVCSVTDYSPLRDSENNVYAYDQTRWFAAREIIVDVAPANACYPNPDPANYGAACTSAANACGQTQAGTIACSGACSAAAPAVTTPTGAVYGADCQGPLNSCGASSAGTITCAGTCSATTAPPTSACNKADLTAGAASPASATVGAATTLSATISNISGPATGGEFTDSFQINPGSIPATFAEIQAIRTYLSANLSSGGSNVASASYTFPSAGTWYVRACADLDASNVGTITESNESNNCSPFWTAVTVTPAGCANGADNPPACNACTLPLVWDGTSCVSCTGGCGPGPSCNNGAQNPPSCSTFTPTATLSANPTVIDQGQSSILTWNSNNATSCTGTGFVAGGTTSGSVSTGALDTVGTQNYQVICHRGSQNSSPALASVEVLAPGASISANPARVPSGNTSAITWSANGVQSCTVTGPGGTIVPSTPSNSEHAFSTGSPYTATITGQSVFTITCQTNSSPVSRSVTVNVQQTFEEF